MENHSRSNVRVPLSLFLAIEDTYDAQREADGSYSVDLSQVKATGNGSASSKANQEKVVNTEVNQPEPTVQSEFFTEALSFAKKGDDDMATDLARSCTADEQRVIQQTLEAYHANNHQ